MEIDNSAANEFRTCPLMYYEGRLAEGTGLEMKPKGNEVAPMDLGSRVHELLEEHYTEGLAFNIPLYPPSSNEVLEMEAQMIIAAYKAKYPQEEFEVVDVEKTFKVALPTYIGGYESQYRHVYTGKIDVTFRQNNKLNIMDHKTEKRQGRGNDPKKWAARDQASLYLWAASKIYLNEEIGNFYVNVLRRPSEKFQEGPVFPERQRLERSAEQLEIAVRDLVFIADDIERYTRTFGDSLWPSNREECIRFGECEFYLPHIYGWDPLIKEQRYQAKTPYLKLGDVTVIQP
jgi:hypothetical protein